METGQPTKTKKYIGFVELPDEALDLFGHYAKRPHWEVSLVVSLNAFSYASRMADILQIPVLERPNRPALVSCDRLIVGNTAGLAAMVNELVEDTDIEVIPLDEALRELGGTPQKKPQTAPASGNKATPEQKKDPPSAEYTSESNFDAGTLLGADFKEKLGAISLNTNADQLLHEILQMAVRVTHADSGSIMLVDEYGTHLRVAVADGLPQWVIAHTRQEVGKGIAGEVFATGKPRLLHGHLPLAQSKSADVRPGLREAACVPIPSKDGPIGVLNITVESEGRKLDESTIILMNFFAREASSAVLKALNLSRLPSSTQREAVIRQVERLMTLQESLPTRLRSVGEVLGQSLGAHYTHCFVVDADGKHLVLFGAGNATGAMNSRPTPLERGFLGWVLNHDQPHVLEVVDETSSENTAMVYIPLGSGSPPALLVLERVSLKDTTAVEILNFITEVKETVESQISLEETTGGLVLDGPLDERSSAA